MDQFYAEENIYNLKTEDSDSKENVLRSCRQMMGMECCISCSSSAISCDQDDGASSKVCLDCGAVQSNTSIIVDEISKEGSSLVFVKKSYELNKNYRKFLAQTYAYANVLHLVPEIVDQVTQLAEKTWQEQRLKQLRVRPRIAAIIYYILRRNRHNLPTTLQIGKTLQVNVRTMYKYSKYIMNHIKLDPVPYTNYLTRIESLVLFCLCSERQKRTLIECAVELESVVQVAAAGSNQNSVAAALLKIATEVHDVKLELRQFCTRFSLNRSRIAELAHEIRLRLLEYAEKIPWKPKNLTCYKHVAKFVPEILRYHQEFGDSVLQDVDNTKRFREKAKVVLDGKQDTSDNVEPLIKELLKKGCTSDEILKDSVSTLSKRYLDFIRDEDYEDEEISEQEIDLLMKSDDINEHKTLP